MENNKNTICRISDATTNETIYVGNLTSSNHTKDLYKYAKAKGGSCTIQYKIIYEEEPSQLLVPAPPSLISILPLEKKVVNPTIDPAVNQTIILEKIDCQCGGCFRPPHKNQHFKTQKHQDYLKNQSSSIEKEEG